MRDEIRNKIREQVEVNKQELENKRFLDSEIDRLFVEIEGLSGLKEEKFLRNEIFPLIRQQREWLKRHGGIPQGGDKI